VLPPPPAPIVTVYGPGETGYDGPVKGLEEVLTTPGRLVLNPPAPPPPAYHPAPPPPPPAMTRYSTEVIVGSVIVKVPDEVKI
jgi:hypothetical protein